MKTYILKIKRLQEVEHSKKGSILIYYCICYKIYIKYFCDSKLGQICYIRLQADTLGKGIDPSYLPAMGKKYTLAPIDLVGKQSTTEINGKLV